MSPYASIAFHPLDGIMQASPYVLTLFLVPMHYLTSMIMLFFTGIWAMNIHVRARRLDVDRRCRVVMLMMATCAAGRRITSRRAPTSSWAPSTTRHIMCTTFATTAR